MFANIPMDREEYDKKQKEKLIIKSEIKRDRKNIHSIQQYNTLGVKENEYTSIEEIIKSTGYTKQGIEKALLTGAKYKWRFWRKNNNPF